MADIISRQDAIEALKICDNNEDGINCYKCPLRDERWDGAWEDDETNCYRKLMRDSAELLSAPPRWIPVTERLPEERGLYLTTTKDKAVYCDHWNEDNFDRTEIVIAWMPLPEPYRKEAER
jgi:hypothetical protein